MRGKRLYAVPMTFGTKSYLPVYNAGSSAEEKTHLISSENPLLRLEPKTSFYCGTVQRVLNVTFTFSLSFYGKRVGSRLNIDGDWGIDGKAVGGQERPVPRSLLSEIKKTGTALKWLLITKSHCKRLTVSFWEWESVRKLISISWQLDSACQ